MTWTVLEQRVIPRDQEQGPEDGLFLLRGGQGYIVADAHSIHEKRPIDGMTPGQFVLGAFGKAFEEIPVPTSKTEIYTWIGGLSACVRSALESKNRFEEAMDPALGRVYRRPGLVFVAFLPHLHYIVRVGDCQYFLDGEGHNPGLKVDRVKANLRWVEMLEAMGDLDPSVPSAYRDKLMRADPTKELMKGLNMYWQQHYRNVLGPYGYAVMNGTPVPYELIEIIEVPFMVKRIILTSDGIPPLLVGSTLDATLQSFHEALGNGSRPGYGDPLCIRDGLLKGVRGAILRPDGTFGAYDDFTCLSLQRQSSLG